jgi:hypothetical protein
LRTPGTVLGIDREAIAMQTSRRGRTGLAAVASIAVLSTLTTACGGDSSDARAATPASRSGSPAQAPTTAATTDAVGSGVSIDPRAALTQRVAARFDPPFALRIPADWTPVLRDVSAFQAYAGNEDYEITFDHTYRSKETVADAIARLTGTDGLRAGKVTDVVIGGREGKGFRASAPAAVMFVDSGFHTNGPATLDVFAVPVDDGTTVTVFLTAGADPRHGIDALEPLARRVFATVAWR